MSSIAAADATWLIAAAEPSVVAAAELTVGVAVEPGISVAGACAGPLRRHQAAPSAHATPHITPRAARTRPLHPPTQTHR